MENASRIKDLYFKKYIEDSPPINLNEGGNVFRQYVSKDLDSLRNIKNEKQKEILAMQEKYCRLTNISNLKIKFNNIHGYFIEVTNKNAEKISYSNEFKFTLSSKYSKQFKIPNKRTLKGFN